MQTKEEMIEAGASEEEAEKAIELFRILSPCLKVNRKTKRIETTHGSKTILGFYRTIHDVVLF